MKKALKIISILALVMLVYLANSARCAAAEGDPDYEFSKATMKRIVQNGQEPISVFTKKKGEGAISSGAIVLNADGSVENKDSYILFTTGAQLEPGGKFGPVKAGDIFFNIGDFPVKVGDYVLKKGEAVLYNGQKLKTIALPDEAGNSENTRLNAKAEIDDNGDAELLKRGFEQLKKLGKNPVPVLKKGDSGIIEFDGTKLAKAKGVIASIMIGWCRDCSWELQDGDAIFNIGSAPVTVDKLVLNRGDCAIFNNKAFSKFDLVGTVEIASRESERVTSSRPQNESQPTKPGPDKEVMKAGKEKAEKLGKNPIFIVNGSIVESQVSIRNNQTVIEDKDMIINAGTEKLNVFHDGTVILEPGEWAISTEGKFKKQSEKGCILTLSLISWV